MTATAYCRGYGQIKYTSSTFTHNSNNMIIYKNRQPRRNTNQLSNNYYHKSHTKRSRIPRRLPDQ